MISMVHEQVPAEQIDDKDDPLFPRLSKEQLELISRCEVGSVDLT